MIQICFVRKLQWSNHVNRFKSKLVIIEVSRIPVSRQPFFHGYFPFSLILWFRYNAIGFTDLERWHFTRCSTVRRDELQKKKDMEIQPGFEPGSSEFRSDALTNEPLELWHWSRGSKDGIYPKTNIVQFSGWMILGFGSSFDIINCVRGF